MDKTLFVRWPARRGQAGCRTHVLGWGWAAEEARGPCRTSAACGVRRAPWDRGGVVRAVARYPPPPKELSREVRPFWRRVRSVLER
jgi:hypothetical protein